MIDFVDVLQHIDLFKGLTLKDIDELIKKDSYNIKEYKKEAVIFFQNEKCMTLDVVIKGVVSIEGIDEKGNYITISDFNAGDVIGENLLFCRKNFYPMTIIAKTDVTIIHLKKDLIMNLCQSNATFLVNFLQSLSDKTLILADRIRTLSFKSLRKSVRDFLIYESYAKKSDKVKLVVSKKTLAEKFGVQRTSLSRELNKMRDEGLIEFDAYSITILDKEALINS